MRHLKKFLVFCAAVALLICASHIGFTWLKFPPIQHEESATMDPWVRKHWNHVKILTDSLSDIQGSKTILFWTKFFGKSNFIPSYSSLGCSKSPKCYVTFNRKDLNRSDALVFHLRDINLRDMPVFRTLNQIWILLHHEAPPHTPTDILEQVNGLFNWTATYRLDSEIILSPTIQKKKKSIEKNHLFIPKREKMVAWFVSNCHTPSNREGYVLELQKTVPVDIFGTCGSYTCLPKMSDTCYEGLDQKYNFYLSFENSICKDYATEKFFRILSTNIVPVVLGGANYSRVAPPHSYVDALDFKTPKDLGLHLLQVVRDDQKYRSYFKWKQTHELVYEHYGCQICRKLSRIEQVFSTYTNISHWWFQDANCRMWSNSLKKLKSHLKRKTFQQL